MTVYALTLTPTTVQPGWMGNTALATSGLIGSAQTTDRQGLKWRFRYGFRITGDDRAEMLGLLAQLRVQSHRLRVPVYDNPARGAYGGTPLVNGASQTGNSLNIDGASLSITNWIRRGDYFSVIVGTEPELKMATTDASSDGSGNVLLTFEPRLRDSPSNGAAIYVQDGVLTVPSGVFLLAEQDIGWESVHRGTPDPVMNVTLDMIEDVFATQ
jgi:hypothetical protein